MDKLELYRSVKNVENTFLGSGPGELLVKKFYKSECGFKACIFWAQQEVEYF